MTARFPAKELRHRAGSMVRGFVAAGLVGCHPGPPGTKPDIDSGRSSVQAHDTDDSADTASDSGVDSGGEEEECDRGSEYTGAEHPPGMSVVGVGGSLYTSNPNTPYPSLSRMEVTPDGDLILGDQWSNVSDLAYVWSGPVAGARDLMDGARVLGGRELILGDPIAWGNGLAAMAVWNGQEGIAGFDEAGTSPVVFVAAGEQDADGFGLSWLWDHGDFTGDGTDDLVLSTHVGISNLDARILDGLTRGAVDLEAADVRVAQSDFESPAAVGDTDGDGFDDLAIGNSADGLRLLRGPLSGLYAVSDADAFLESLASVTSIGDFDGDGRRDIVGYSLPELECVPVAYVVPIPEDRVYSRSDAVLAAHLNANINARGSTVTGALDFNADDRDDLAFGFRPSEKGDSVDDDDDLDVWIVFGPSNGTIEHTMTETGQTNLYLPESPHWNMRYVSAGFDLDADGFSDLAIARQEEADVLVIPGSAIAAYAAEE